MASKREILGYNEIQNLVTEYKDKHKPVFIDLLLKEGFFDIYLFQESIFPDEKKLHSFVNSIIKSIKIDDFSYFKHKYLHYGFNYGHINENEISGLNWWLPYGMFGESHFKKPGAILVKEVDDYWVISMFSRKKFGKQRYKDEIKSLNELVEKLGY